MKIVKETEEKSYKFVVDLSTKESAVLKEYGLKSIENDDEALINYAINKIVENYISKWK